MYNLAKSGNYQLSTLDSWLSTKTETVILPFASLKQSLQPVSVSENAWQSHPIFSVLSM